MFNEFNFPIDLNFWQLLSELNDCSFWPNLSVLTIAWPQLYLTNINKIYSVFPPLFLTTAFNLPSKASHAARSFSWEIKFYSRRKFAFQS